MRNKILAVAAPAIGGVLLWKLLTKTRSPGANSSVEAASLEAASVEVSIEVDVPVRTAYMQWARFEDFPKFMSGVHEVLQVDDQHLHWRADGGGKEKKWTAEIVEQIPFMRIAWRSTSGVRNATVVSFQKVSETSTKIVLQTDCDPGSFNAPLSDALDAARIQAKDTLNNFKNLLEHSETVS